MLTYPDPLDEGDAFIAYCRECFDRLSKADQERCIVQAAADMELVFNFRGVKKSDRQSLAWPRRGVRDESGNEITGIPDSVKAGQAEIALMYGAKLSLLEPRILARLSLIMKDVLDPDEPFLNPQTSH